jgi:hypothetical protein
MEVIVRQSGSGIKGSKENSGKRPSKNLDVLSDDSEISDFEDPPELSLN